MCRIYQSRYNRARLYFLECYVMRESTQDKDTINKLIPLFQLFLCAYRLFNTMFQLWKLYIAEWIKNTNDWLD